LYSVLADMFPDVNLIYGHMGLGYFWRDAIRSAKVYDNVYLETSGNTYPFVDYAVKALGASKIILGSDFPHEHPLVSVKIVQLLELSNADRDLILGQNIEEILKS
jgi:predicted TIM-barrel fold metal-dependent hydrolase